MAKRFSVDGKLKELKTNPDGSKTVVNVAVGQKGLFRLFTDPNLAVVAQNILRIANSLDDDTGVCSTDYSNKVISGK